MKASCGAVSLVSTSSDSVDEAESELEKQEVKVRKGRTLKKEVRVEAGKEESLEDKKQLDTSVSEALLKVLETLPADTKAFLQPALAPPAASKKREPEKVPSQSQATKKLKSSKSVAVGDGVSLGNIDLMVAQLNKGIFGKMGTCSMIERVNVPDVVQNFRSPSYGVAVAQYATYMTHNKAGHGSQILLDLAARFGNVQFVPHEVGGMLCLVAKVSRLSAEEMRHVSDFKLNWREEGFQTCFVNIPKDIIPSVPDHFMLGDSGSTLHLVWGGDLAFKLKESFVMISGFDGQLSSSTQVGWLSMVVPALLNNSVWGVKTLTSGVDDCYVKPDIPKQIFSITRAVAQGAKCCLDDELPGLFFTSEDKVRVYVPFVRVEPEEGSLGSPKFFVPCSPPVRAHGFEFDLNLDKLTRRSGGGVRNTYMAGAAVGAASSSGM